MSLQLAFRRRTDARVARLAAERNIHVLSGITATVTIPVRQRFPPPSPPPGPSRNKTRRRISFFDEIDAIFAGEVVSGNS